MSSVLAACSPSASGDLTVGAVTDPATNPSGNRFFEPGSDLSLFHNNYPEYHDIRDLAEAADVVFIGTVIGTRTNVAVMIDTDPSTTIFDGIEFEVLEVLSGSIPDGQRTVAVAHPVFKTDPSKGDSNQLVAVRVPPIDLIRRGIQNSANVDQRVDYVVFASLRTFGAGIEYLGFNGPGSIAPLAPDGTTVMRTGFQPFFVVDGARNDSGIDITTDVIRSWIMGDGPVIEEPDQ